MASSVCLEEGNWNRVGAALNILNRSVHTNLQTDLKKLFDSFKGKKKVEVYNKKFQGSYPNKTRANLEHGLVRGRMGNTGQLR